MDGLSERVRIRCGMAVVGDGGAVGGGGGELKKVRPREEAIRERRDGSG